MISKPANVKSSLKQSLFSVKISDFGQKDTFKYVETGNVLAWKAPELLASAQKPPFKFSYASDTWAYAVTLWEILTGGRTPYDQLENFWKEVQMKGNLLDNSDL